MLEIKNLSKTFGPVKAVDDVTFTVNKGEIFGLLGTNGAGKTTTMKVLACLLKPTSGGAFVNGLDVTKNCITVKETIGYDPDSWISKVRRRRLEAHGDDIRAHEQRIINPDPLPGMAAPDCDSAMPGQIRSNT